MYCTDFEFDGKRLSQFGYVMSALEGISSGTFPSGADLQFSQGRASGSDVFELYDTHYDEPYTLTFTVCKDPCHNATQEEMYLSPREISFLQRWLCRRNEFCKFKIDQDGFRDIYWMGSFTSQMVTFCGRIVGLELTLHTDSPYAYCDDITIEGSMAANSDFVIYDLSDEEGVTAPDIKLTVNSSGTLRFSNSRDDQVTIIENCTSGETFTFDGKHLVITSSNSSHELGKDFNFIFPKLYNSIDDTKNTFQSSLSCYIELTYAPAIKVGL